MNTRKFLIALAVLVLAALACNFGRNTGSPTSVPQATADTGDSGSQSNEDGQAGDSSQPEDAGSTPTQSEGGGDGEPTGTTGGSKQLQSGEPLDLDDLSIYNQPELFNWFKTSLDYSFEAEGPVTGTVDLQSATQVDPYASNLTFFTDGAAVFGSGDVFTFTQIDQTQYVVFPGLGCQSGAPGVQENPFEVGLDDGGLLTGMAAYEGEENVNGVDAFRYRLTMDNIDPLDPAGVDFESLSNGLVWAAQDGGYVVRLILEGRGASEVLTQDAGLVGDIYYEINFFDFDIPVTIEIPPACQSTGVGIDFPMPDDAANVSSLAGIISFTTGLSVDETQDFYEDALDAHGCGESSAFGDATTGYSIIVAGCDFGDAQILLTPEGDGTLVSVFITSE